MKVSFRRSGGFAPMPLSCTIDTDTCSAEDAIQLRSLVASSGVMQASSATVPGARDVRLYVIDIEDDDLSHEVKFDDISIPAAVRPLIDFLQARSKNVFGDED